MPCRTHNGPPKTDLPSPGAFTRNSPIVSVLVFGALTSAGEPLVGDLLDVRGGHFEQLVSQLGQGPGDGQLVADLRHVAVNRI